MVKNKQIYLLGIVMLLLGKLSASAIPDETEKEPLVQQNIKITGSVYDNSGAPIPGVSVVVKGTSIGTATDINGEYSITVPDENAVLEFISLGFQTRETIVGSRRVISVSMDEAAQEIGEVVVTAFGKTKRQSNVASIETVKVDGLRIPATNLTSALSGRVSGLISYLTSGEPGNDNAQFFVRGVTAFGYKVDPLILIDGFEATKDDLARLHPDDIESFSLMKDASATVMYGARSANGIIAVVTKAGHEGPVKVSARLDYQIATPTQVPRFLDGVEYMKLYNEAITTRNPEEPPFYKEQKILATSKGEHPIMYPNVDWYDALFRKTTMNMKANINVQGGGKVATYYVAMGYEKENGLLKVDKLNNFNSNISIDRVQIRTNVIFNLTPTTKLDTRISGRFQRYLGPNKSVTEIWRDIMNSNPVDFPFTYEADEAHKDADWILFGSTIQGGSVKTNPYAEMVRGFETRNENNMTAMATLLQDFDFITPGLKLQLKASVSNHGKFSIRRSYVPRMYGLEYYNQISGEHKLYDLNPNSAYPNLGTPRMVKDADQQIYFEGLLRWDNTFGLHSVGGTVVGLIQENLIFPDLMSNTGFEVMPERNLGVSGRFTYDYDTRYFLDLSWGYNGSEKFTGNRQFGFFPAVGVGWLLSNEKFWEPMKNVLSSFKLKASWGTSGNDAITKRENRFGFLSRIQMGGSDYAFGETFLTGYSGYSIERYANADIRWETSTMYNFGTEISLFKNETVKLQGDFFFSDRQNIYLDRESIPGSAGFEALPIKGNSGRIKAHGFDGSIDVEHFFSKDLWIQGRGNFTYNTNKLVELDERNYTDKYLSHKGYSFNQHWGFIGERLFIDDNEIYHSPQQVWGRYEAGDIKYKDINGDGVINDNDRVAMGFPDSPEIQYGFGLSMGYKNWDLSFFFQGNARISFFINAGVGGGDDGTEGIAPFQGQRNAVSIVARDHWSETNPNEHAFYPRLSVTSLGNNTLQSSWWMRDGSFMRMKTLELGYKLPSKIEKIGMKNCRIYLACENLFVVSPFKLWDPEMRRNGLGYPPNKRFNIGVHMSF